jgi:hypothetical protein
MYANYLCKACDVLIMGKMNVEQHHAQKIHKVVKVSISLQNSSSNFKDICHENLLVKVNYFLKLFLVAKGNLFNF